MPYVSGDPKSDQAASRVSAVNVLTRDTAWGLKKSALSPSDIVVVAGSSDSVPLEVQVDSLSVMSSSEVVGSVIVESTTSVVSVAAALVDQDDSDSANTPIALSCSSTNTYCSFRFASELRPLVRYAVRAVVTFNDSTSLQLLSDTIQPHSIHRGASQIRVTDSNPGFSPVTLSSSARLPTSARVTCSSDPLKYKNSRYINPVDSPAYFCKLEQHATSAIGSEKVTTIPGDFAFRISGLLDPVSCGLTSSVADQWTFDKEGGTLIGSAFSY